MTTWRKRFYGSLCSLCLAMPVGANETSASLTLDQARVVADSALRAGNAELARSLAMGLLQADETDGFAYAILAAAHSKLNNPGLARSAARLSYKYATTPEQSYASARTAGRIALQQERFNASQLWFRRAALHAPNERATRLLGRDYAQARSVNPLSLRFNLSVSPSDNVNSGSDSALFVINGEPQLGTIAVSSQALSGTVATADLNIKYRLHQTRTSQSFAIARAYTRQVILSSESRAAAPTVSNSDLASTYAEVGLQHSFVMTKNGTVMNLHGSTGKTWSAGDSTYSFGKFQVNPTFKLSKSTSLSLVGSLEKRWSTVSDQNDQTLTQLSARLSHKLAKRDRISFGVTLLDVHSDARNGSYQSGSLNLNYSFGKQIGPMKLSTGLTLGYTDFDEYTLIGPVDGGRQDLSLYGDVTMMFTDFDLAGFAPTVRLRTGRKSSNISRFDTREMSVSIGIQSKF